MFMYTLKTIEGVEPGRQHSSLVTTAPCPLAGESTFEYRQTRISTETSITGTLV